MRVARMVPLASIRPLTSTISPALRPSSPLGTMSESKEVVASTSTGWPSTARDWAWRLMLPAVMGPSTVVS